MSVAIIPLSSLAADINKEHTKAAESMWAGLQHAIRAGELLIEAKRQVEHGQWLPWLEANCEFSERTAQGYMRLAKELPKLDAEKRNRVADLTFRDALKSIAVTSKNLRSFSEPQAEALFENAENNSVCRATIIASRSIHQRQDPTQTPTELQPIGEGRRIQVLGHQTESKCCIVIGPNLAGIHFEANRDALLARDSDLEEWRNEYVAPLEAQIAERKDKIAELEKQIKGLKAEITKLDTDHSLELRIWNAEIDDRLEREHGPAYPITETIDFDLDNEFAEELRRIHKGRTPAELAALIMGSPDRITEVDHGFYGDMKYWFSQPKTEGPWAKSPHGWTRIGGSDGLPKAGQ